MLFNHKTASADKLASLIKQSQNVYAITGAGISTNAGIPDLQHLAGRTSSNLSSESSLEQEPQRFYRIFIDPIFHNGPTVSHKALAKLEDMGLLKCVVTTNVYYLHELAGSKHVADVWGSLNENYCLDCGRTYDINILKSPLPHCPVCGGLISPGPVYHHIGLDDQALDQAYRWTDKADLIIVIGSNGYYNHVGHAKVVNINSAHNSFDAQADFVIRQDADRATQQLLQLLK